MTKPDTRAATLTGARTALRSPHSTPDVRELARRIQRNGGAEGLVRGRRTIAQGETVARCVLAFMALPDPARWFSAMTTLRRHAGEALAVLDASPLPDRISQFPANQSRERPSFRRVFGPTVGIGAGRNRAGR